MVKASLVNKKTNVVENVIMVNSLEDKVPEGFYLAPMVTREMLPNLDKEYDALQKILADIAPDYKLPTVDPIIIEVPIQIGLTKWNPVNKEYYED
jgi:hypothetical protein